MRCLKAAILVALLASVCFANVFNVISLKGSIRRISGRVMAHGTVNPGVDVRVFDHPEVWSEKSLSMVEKRERQSIIASTVTDKKGNFAFRKIGKGSYEVEFSKDGWDTVSVLVVVDPSAPSDRICVNMPISEAGGEASAQTCRP